MWQSNTKNQRVIGVANQATVAAPPQQLQILAFSKDDFSEAILQDAAEITAYMQKYQIVWVSVVGIEDLEQIKKIAALFNLNSLTVEDILDVHQRIKVEKYDQEAFSVFKIPQFINNQLNMRQVSMFWGANFILSFLEAPTDCMQPLIARIKTKKPRDRLLNTEYLAYSIIDMIIDSFFPIMENYGVTLDSIETHAIDNPSTKIMSKIHALRRDLHIMQRSIWSQRDAITSFKELVAGDQEMWFYLRDCQDHTIQLLEIVETYIDRSGGVIDIYLVSVNNRTNQIVKQLTIIATLFMPIGVLAGIYGMNFDRSSHWNMPELGWKFGYEYFWCIVVTFLVCSLTTFWRKGWFKV